MIVVLDYGAGNLCSVSNTLNALQAPHGIVRNAAELHKASKIILPGVGHFGQMMRALDSMGLREPLIDLIRSGVPFFGICLGMQALFEGSDEAPEAKGLGLFPGRAERFRLGLRVPHMGWNQLQVSAASRLFRPFVNKPKPWFYFAHSYYVAESNVSAASCDYSVPYMAAIECKAIFGVQFHPEKSGVAGQQLVSQFLHL